MSFAENLKKARESVYPAMSQTDLASILGVTPQAVNQWETGASKPDPARIPAIAAAVKTPWQELVPNKDPLSELARLIGQTDPFSKFFPANKHEAPARVPVVGYIGSKDMVHFYDLPFEDLDTVAAPLEPADATVALEIKSDTLGPSFRRALVFFANNRTLSEPPQLSRLHVVEISDGRTLLKRIEKGTKSDFKLVSDKEDPIDNQPVLWASPLKAFILK